MGKVDRGSQDILLHLEFDKVLYIVYMLHEIVVPVKRNNYIKEIYLPSLASTLSQAIHSTQKIISNTLLVCILALYLQVCLVLFN